MTRFRFLGCILSRCCGQGTPGDASGSITACLKSPRAQTLLLGPPLALGASLPAMTLLVWVVLRGAAERVLLARRQGTAYANGLWGLPGGRVESGETLQDAARREVHEEIGVEVTGLGVFGVSRFEAQGQPGVAFLFLAKQWQGEPTPLDLTSEVGWFALDALPPDALPWLAPVLDLHLRRGVRVSEQHAGTVTALHDAPLRQP